MEHAPIVAMFGPSHTFILATMFLAGAAYIGAAASRPDESGKQRMGYLLGLFTLGEEIVDRLTRIAHHDRWAELLPLHVCGLVIILIAVMLIAKERRLFQVCYYWGVGGALPSLLTPDCREPFPNPIFFTYFMSHGLILAGALYALVVFRWRPTLRGVGLAFVLVNVYSVFAGAVNYALDTNFMYLCAKPHSATIMDWMHGWPWYIAEMEPIVLGICLLLYAPFFLGDRRLARSGAAALEPASG